MIVVDNSLPLPMELQERVCEYLDVKTLCEASLTCSSLNQLISKNRICQSEILLEFTKKHYL